MSGEKGYYYALVSPYDKQAVHPDSRPLTSIAAEEPKQKPKHRQLKKPPTNGSATSGGLLFQLLSRRGWPVVGGFANAHEIGIRMGFQEAGLQQTYFLLPYPAKDLLYFHP
ncbi:hypothetical protein GCM10011375_21340 [Hymenobacter qilianensis]|uniref:Uncharacterized protein n=1 Tax=Hymenobacter qilianensis TaxID=1385715 RepID=A0ACB5PS04_9BACT|nr:hypothetical protein GCM10011375_21340 [Hymenobacter qilianensis]